MEFLDIVNENDEVIERASKKDVYKKSLCHRIVHIIIFNDKNELALQLRSANVSYLPGYWSTSVGGHVQSGESYKEAALREYKEELGVTSNLEDFSKDYYKAEGTPNKFLGTFRTFFNGPFQPDLKDVERVDFFTINKIREMINEGGKFHPELLFLLEKYFQNE